MSTPTPVSVTSLPAPSTVAARVLPALERLLGARVSAQEQDRLSYSRDMSPRALMWVRKGRIPPPPDLVAWPKTEEELVELVRLAREHQLALIPFGAGSGVCGGTWAVRGGIAVDLKRFDEIGTVDPERLCVDVGAGVMGEVLERALNAQGYTLGHFPSSIYMSTVGGWLATRGAGQLSSRYGKIEDMVLAVTGVLGTGEVVRTSERPAPGVDVAQLLVGSEGTLGAITRARLRVLPLPEHRTFRGLEFRTVGEGLEAIRRLFHAGLRPAVVRLYDPFDTALEGRSKPKAHGATPPSLRSPLQTQWIPSALRQLSSRVLGRPTGFNKLAGLLRRSLLLVVFEGEARRVVAEDERARALCVAAGGEDLGEEPARHWWSRRYAVSYKMSPLMDGGAFGDTMEVAVTWDRVLDVYERVRLAVTPLAFVLCHFSHAYLEGCSLYFSFVGTEGSDDGDRRYDELWRAALSAALSAGATVSHHHGAGLLKQRYLLEELGDGKRLLFALKRAMDPDGVMNPGKLGMPGPQDGTP